MTKKIYKYEIPVQDDIRLDVPIGAKVLTVQADEKTGNPCIWMLVDPEEFDKEERRFRLSGTGHPIEDENNHAYIGTFQIHRGEFIGHLFEVLPNSR